MDFIEGGTIKHLRNLIKSYLDTSDDENSRNMVEVEIQKIMDIVE